MVALLAADHDLAGKHVLEPREPRTVVAWRVNPVRQPKDVLETVRSVARNLAQSQGMD